VKKQFPFILTENEKKSVIRAISNRYSENSLECISANLVNEDQFFNEHSDGHEFTLPQGNSMKLSVTSQAALLLEGTLIY
jgi:hypothetical protein